MDNAQVQITAKPPGPAVAPVPLDRAVPVQRRGPASLPFRLLQKIASLRLTVVLFALSIILVFCGTLAQVDAGIWTVVGKYFRSAYVWIPLQIFFPRDMKVGGGFPFPGGWLLGSLLLVNLLAAHTVRFKASWKRSGIIILHLGLIVMMLSELITGLYAVEGSMLIQEGSTSNFVFHPRETELAVMPAGAGDTTEVVVVPMAILQRVNTPIKSDALPFDVEVVQYMVNSRLYKLKSPEFCSLLLPDMAEAPNGANNQATAGFGASQYLAMDRPETSGVAMDDEDLAAAYVRFRNKSNGEELGTYLLALLLRDEPQFVTVDGKKYDVRLRFKRTYKPYQMYLVEFRHDKYVGTEIPKNYSSRVKLTDPANNVDREILISMNDPLRHGGETFYQQSFQSVMGKKATVLQVVRNPGWLMPYISCIMVAIGMLIHFGLHLHTFLGRRAMP